MLSTQDHIWTEHSILVIFRQACEAEETSLIPNFHIMASLVEMERELTIQRTRAGLEVVRQLGRKGGRQRHRNTRQRCRYP